MRKNTIKALSLFMSWKHHSFFSLFLDCTLEDNTPPPLQFLNSLLRWSNFIQKSAQDVNNLLKMAFSIISLFIAALFIWLFWLPGNTTELQWHKYCLLKPKYKRSFTQICFFLLFNLFTKEGCAVLCSLESAALYKKNSGLQFNPPP